MSSLAFDQVKRVVSELWDGPNEPRVYADGAEIMLYHHRSGQKRRFALHRDDFKRLHDALRDPVANLKADIAK